MSGESSDPTSRPAVVVAAGLAVALAVAVVLAGKLLTAGAPPAPGPPSQSQPAAPRTEPVALVPVDAPEAGSALCTGLLSALPVEMTSARQVLRQLPLAQPAPPATRAWGDRVGEPVVLRCGLSRPPELTPTARLREISGVRWLPVSGAGASTWYVVDRAVYLALTVPAEAGTGPLQGISEAVGKALPVVGVAVS